VRYTEMHPQSPERSELAADDPGLSAAVLVSLYDYEIRPYPVEGEEKSQEELDRVNALKILPVTNEE
jgi:hypothetical protein